MIPTGAGSAGAGPAAPRDLEAAGLEQPCSPGLIREAQAGSLEAFEVIVAQFESRLFTYLHQFTRNAHDAEDLTQVTFLKAFRNLKQFDAGRSLTSWLFTIARRSAISHFRAAKSREVESPEECLDRSDVADPSIQLVAKDDGAALWELAQRLKPRQREALWLHYGEDFPVAECARIMGLTQIHVKVLLHRGRHTLGKLILNRRADPSLPNHLKP